jgi:hypothetical protein
MIGDCWKPAIIGVTLAVAGASWASLPARGDPSKPESPEAQHEHAVTGHAPTRQEMRRSRRCMREHGIGVGPGGFVAPGSLDVTSKRVRRAMFVTCRLPMNFNAGDRNVVVGLEERAELDRFVACMGREGFDLPPAARGVDADGSPNYVFDLSTTKIDLDSDAWNEAAFVQCAPGVPLDG